MRCVDVGRRRYMEHIGDQKTARRVGDPLHCGHSCTYRVVRLEMLVRECRQHIEGHLQSLV
jgi:hypothetical protein